MWQCCLELNSVNFRYNEVSGNMAQSPSNERRSDEAQKEIEGLLFKARQSVPIGAIPTGRADVTNMNYDKYTDVARAIVMMRELLPAHVSDADIATECHYIGNGLHHSATDHVKNPRYRPKRKTVPVPPGVTVKTPGTRTGDITRTPGTPGENGTSTTTGGDGTSTTESDYGHTSNHTKPETQDIGTDTTGLIPESQQASGSDGPECTDTTSFCIPGCQVEPDTDAAVMQCCLCGKLYHPACVGQGQTPAAWPYPTCRTLAAHVNATHSSVQQLTALVTSLVQKLNDHATKTANEIRVLSDRCDALHKQNATAQDILPIHA